MGCINSVSEPNLMQYQSKEKQLNNNNNKNKIHPKEGEIVKSGDFDSSNRNQIKGDLFTYNFMKLSRKKALQIKMEEREKLAQEISARVSDERESLSLSTIRSRATSKAVSPRNTAQVGLSGFSSANTTQLTQEQDLSGVFTSEPLDSGSEIHHRKSSSDGLSLSPASHMTDMKSCDVQRLNIEELGTTCQQDDLKSANHSPELQSHDQGSAYGMSTIESDGGGLLEEEGKMAKKSKHHKFKKKAKNSKMESNVSVRNDMISHG